MLGGCAAAEAQQKKLGDATGQIILNIVNPIQSGFTERKSAFWSPNLNLTPQRCFGMTSRERFTPDILRVWLGRCISERKSDPEFLCATYNIDFALITSCQSHHMFNDGDTLVINMWLVTDSPLWLAIELDIFLYIY